MSEDHPWFNRLAPGEVTKRTPGRGLSRTMASHRLSAKVALDQETGCLNFLGSMSHNGYGQLGVYYEDGKRLVRTHRLAYKLVNGAIPVGMQIDHLCRNRRCCNPAHLEAVTSHENTRRGQSPSARNAAATHCPHGHPYTPINTLVYAGKRYCWACKTMRRSVVYSARTAMRLTEILEQNPITPQG